jgi:hypothetical protein
MCNILYGQAQQNLFKCSAASEHLTCTFVKPAQHRQGSYASASTIMLNRNVETGQLRQGYYAAMSGHLNLVNMHSNVWVSAQQQLDNCEVQLLSIVSHRDQLRNST